MNGLERAGQLYAAAPVMPSGRTLRAEVVAEWAAFGAAMIAQADRVKRSGLAVYTTSDAEPYIDGRAQSADVIGGRFLVSRAHCEHPVWSVEQNVAFRIVHDVTGHHRLSAGFDPAGELLVWADAARREPHWARVLWSESVAQLGFCLLAGGFGDEQKLVVA